ncbi:Conserved_hypothetical protein [Hexamita inflata]|uniref:TNFR-Cys domain-containing protein n=1 Tax=Hexamita inflata TaxID=28002 RepID=A0AA86NQC1_9EUKA|nr:Conserved hypothetical protein [Hexamita inflata]CAI9923494.1 Conserved hypothetical protein [Hexamita inflata]
MRFILLIMTIQSHVVYDQQTTVKSSNPVASAVSCKKQLLYNSEIVQYCEKHQSLSSVSQLGQFTYSHDSQLFNSLYTEKAQDVTLNFTVNFKNLPQFALFGLVSQISIEDSNVSVNIPQQLEAGALVCFQCALNASSSRFSFSASGQNASGLVMTAQAYLKLDFVLVQARLRGNSGGLAFSSTQTAFSLSGCNVSCYLVEGSSRGVIIGSVLDITFIADDALVCVNDNIPNFGSGAVSIQGSIVNNCDLCGEFHFAFGLCLKSLDFGELRQNSLVCSESFEFDGQVCSCPPGFIFNVSKCINLLEVSSELLETSFTLYQELNQKVSYTYLQSQISDITVQLQSDKDELKTEVANIKKECEDSKKQLSLTITGLQQQVTELQQTVMQLKAEKENYFTKEEIQQMIQPLLCPVGAKIVDGSCTCPELAVVTNGICTCPPYSSVVDDKCQCGQYAAMTKYGCECRDDMAMQPNGVCVCPNPSQVVIDDICQCPIKGQILNGICQCQDGASIVNNECQCPVDSVTVNNGPMTYCKCPDSLPQKISERCCPTFAEVSGSSCKCPENSVVAGNSCKCDSNAFTFSSSSVLVCQACPSGSSPDAGQTTCVCSGNGVYTQANNSCTVQECSGNSFYSPANKSCTVCGANSTVSSNICVCDSNSYQTNNVSGSLTCFTCPVGSVSNNNTKTCDCSGNSFYSSSNNSCTACGANSTVQNNICFVTRIRTRSVITQVHQFASRVRLIPFPKMVQKHVFVMETFSTSLRIILALSVQLILRQITPNRLAFVPTSNSIFLPHPLVSPVLSTIITSFPPTHAFLAIPESSTTLRTTFAQLVYLTLMLMETGARAIQIHSRFQKQTEWPLAPNVQMHQLLMLVKRLAFVTPTSSTSRLRIPARPVLSTTFTSQAAIRVLLARPTSSTTFPATDAWRAWPTLPQVELDAFVMLIPTRFLQSTVLRHAHNVLVDQQLTLERLLAIVLDYFSIPLPITHARLAQSTLNKLRIMCVSATMQLILKQLTIFARVKLSTNTLSQYSQPLHLVGAHSDAQLYQITHAFLMEK